MTSKSRSNRTTLSPEQEQQVIAYFQDDGYTIEQIEDLIHVTRWNVLAVLKKYRIPTHKGPSSLLDRLSVDELQRFVDMWQEEASYAEIAVEFNITPTQVYQYAVKKLGLPLRRVVGSNVDKVAAMELAVRMYKEGETITMIQAATKIGPTTLRVQLLRQGVPLRRYGRDRTDMVNKARAKMGLPPLVLGPTDKDNPEEK